MCIDVVLEAVTRLVVLDLCRSGFERTASTSSSRTASSSISLVRIRACRIYVDPESESGIDVIKPHDFHTLLSFYGDGGDGLPAAARNGIELLVEMPGGGGAAAAAAVDASAGGAGAAAAELPTSGRRRRRTVTTHVACDDDIDYTDINGYSSDDERGNKDDGGAAAGACTDEPIDLSGSQCAAHDDGGRAGNVAATPAAAESTPAVGSSGATAPEPAAASFPTLLSIPAECQEHLAGVSEGCGVWSGLACDGVGTAPHAARHPYAMRGALGQWGVNALFV